MEKTVCELFAGVGGFRCGLNHIRSLSDLNKFESWKTVWFNQYEPTEKKTQYAYGCYTYHWGSCLDTVGEDTTNIDIEQVDKYHIPDFNLMVAGFPCQDYSVASSLSSSKGIEGTKGVLWWSLCEIMQKKRPAFVLLENVDRLLKSPASQQGRDFGIILSCFQDMGYTVEWRVVNAAEYGYQQRRRRVFIFAYRNDTKYSKQRMSINIQDTLYKDGFFAKTFPIQVDNNNDIMHIKFNSNIGEVSARFKFNFENAGILKDGIIYTVKTEPNYQGDYKTLGDILETSEVDTSYFISDDKLYYTNSSITHSNELDSRLPIEDRRTWQYIKGAKKYKRRSKTGYDYIYSEGAISLIDETDKPARTLLTSEGSFSRTTHLVRDKKTGDVWLLTAAETERIQGFPTDFTKYCYTDGKKVEMPINKRRFMMGNALVVDLIIDMEKTLDQIFKAE